MPKAQSGFALNEIQDGNQRYLREQRGRATDAIAAPCVPRPMCFERACWLDCFLYDMYNKMCMGDVEFQRALRAAQDELKQAFAQRQALDKRILELRQLIVSLHNAIASGQGAKARRGGLPGAFAEFTLMDEVRAVFKAKHSDVLSAQDVIDELTRLGHNMERYQQPLATIGVMLGRLKEKGEIVIATDRDGKRGFMARYPFLTSVSPEAL